MKLNGIYVAAPQMSTLVQDLTSDIALSPSRKQKAKSSILLTSPVKRPGWRHWRNGIGFGWDHWSVPFTGAFSARLRRGMATRPRHVTASRSFTPIVPRHACPATATQVPTLFRLWFMLTDASQAPVYLEPQRGVRVGGAFPSEGCDPCPRGW